MNKDNGSFTNLVEDYAVTPVPYEQRTNGLKVGLINSAICLTLPSMVVGAQLGLALGFKQALLVCFAAVAMLVPLGTLTGLVGSRAGVSTYVILRFPLGSSGSKLVSLIFALSMFGWIGINIALFGDAAAGLMQKAGITVSPAIGMVAGGLLVTLTGIFGFKALDKLALVLVPVLVGVVLILYKQAQALRPLSELLAMQPEAGGMSFGLGVSVLVGGMIMICVAQPDLTRYTRTLTDSFWAVFAPFAIAQPFVIIGVGLGAVAYQDNDVIGLLLKSGFGLWAFLMIISSSWVGSAVNLYACSLSLAAILQGIEKWKLAILTGIAGTVVGLLGILERFTDFLTLLSIIVSPVAGLYLLDFFWLNGGRYSLERIDRLPMFRWRGAAAVLSGALVGYATAQGLLQLTGISSLDAILTSMCIYLLVNLRTGKTAVLVEGKTSPGNLTTTATSKGMGEKR